MMTIESIIYGCWLGGISVEQRYCVAQGREAELIAAYLALPQVDRFRIYVKAVRGEFQGRKQP